MQAKKKVALIHTTTVVINPMISLFRDMLPKVTVINLVDEGILDISKRVGMVNPQVVKRVCTLAVMAEETGADGCIYMCSATVSAIDVARKLVDIPILKINQPMFEKASENWRKIGILATDRPTLEPSARFLREIAKKNDRRIIIESALVEKVFAVLLAGDAEKHDRLVLSAARALSRSVDVILLAQASMVEIVHKAEKTIHKPVLASPRLAIERIKNLLNL